MKWLKRIKIKHLLTDSEDYNEIQESMNKIASILEQHKEFEDIVDDMRHIPKGDVYFSPSDYANKMLARMYDIADMERIWVE